MFCMWEHSNQKYSSKDRSYSAQNERAKWYETWLCFTDSVRIGKTETKMNDKKCIVCKNDGVFFVHKRLFLLYRNVLDVTDLEPGYLCYTCSQTPFSWVILQLIKIRNEKRFELLLLGAALIRKVRRKRISNENLGKIN